MHGVRRSALTYTSDTALKRYSASPGRYRTFCGDCGSLMSWEVEGTDEVSLCVGTFDQDVLRRYGRVLTDAKRHFFCGEQVEGVTDHLKGERWVGDNEGEGAMRMD